MYLLSKSKIKFLTAIFISLILFFFAFSGLLRYLIFFTYNQLLYHPLNNQQRINELTAKNTELRLKLTEAKAYREENKKLKAALNFKDKSNYQLIGAEVLAFSPSTWQRSIIVNAGSKNGVTSGLFVIDEEGNLLGRVIEAEKEFSRLILVSDPEFRAPVIIGDDVLGFLSGGLTGARVLYAEDRETIKLGDKVSLKIYQLAYPIEIGRVKSLNQNQDSLFWDVQVELFHQGNFLNQVYIIK